MASTEDKGHVDKNLNKSSEFESKLMALLEAVAPVIEKEEDVAEKFFKKLLGNPLARCRLEHIHSARAFKYGHAQFGAKSWYKEGPGLASKLKNIKNRRKFRQGLRSNVDFVNQLNIMNLKALFEDGDEQNLALAKLEELVQPKELFECLKAVPPIKILELVNSKKAANLTKMIKTITDVAHFGQSMASFFALDDALEPALAAVCEVLRSNPNIGSILEKRCTSFLAIAQCYQKQCSPLDMDISPSTPKMAQPRAKRKRIPGRSSEYQYSRGVCFSFQRGECRRGASCSFTHKCDNCGNTGHGARVCRNR